MVEAPLESAPGAASPDAVPTPEVAPAVAGAMDFAPASEISPVAENASVGSTEFASDAPTAWDAPAASSPAEQLDSPAPIAENEKRTSAEEMPPAATEKVEPAAEAGEGTPVKHASVLGSTVLSAVRLLLKETKAGAAAGKVERLADELGRPAEEFVATLVDAGLRVPEKPREKPVCIEHAGELARFATT